MKNSNVLAKSKGVLLFAFNTNTVNYVKIAEQAARLINHTLCLPVTLITDATTTSKYFDQVIYIENTLKNRRSGVGGGQQWRNGNRYQAYDLSPYDETILLDSDYLVLDQSLLKILSTVDDYRIMVNNQSPTQKSKSSMGFMSLQHVWATVIVFRKTKKTKMMFDLVGKIQRNYEYYLRLYQMQNGNFRNDYAFAIADHILNGYTASAGILWTMLTVNNPISDIEIQNNKLIVREKDIAYIVPKQNLHILDKEYLLSDNYNKFVEIICQK